MASPLAKLPKGYSLQSTTAPLEAYLNLRSESGLSPVTETQALGAIANTWFGVHITYTQPVSEGQTGASPPEIVGMGRVIGGGWYFHVADVAVLPTHQRKGLGKAIMEAILNEVKEKAEPGFYINLLADAPGRKLYGSLGFKETMPEELGMGVWIGGRKERKMVN